MKKLLPRRITVAIYGGAVVFLSAILGAVLLITTQMRDQVVVDTKSQATRFLSSSEASLNRSLLGVDLLLSSLGELLRTSSQATARADASRPQVARLMQVSADQNLLIRYAAVLTPGGEVLASSDRRGAGLPVQLPTGFLEQVLKQPIPTLAVSTPSVSALSSQRVVHFARDIQLSDGTHLVTLAEVQVSLLTAILTQGADIRGLEVTLEQDAGPVLASFPPRDDLSGRIVSPVLSERTSDGTPTLSPARLSGEPAILVAQPTLHRNLLIVASINLQLALQEWRRQRSFMLIMAAIFMLTILVVAYLIHMHLRGQWRSKATLDQALESMADGFVLLDSNDRVLTWNRRFVEIFPTTREVIRPMLPFRKIAVPDAVAGRSGTRDEMLSSESRPRAGEQELMLAQGQIVLAVKTPTPDGGLMCVFRDVTEKRRYIADILDGKAQLQATLEALPDVLIELDLEGRCHRFHSPPTHVPVIDTPDPIGKSIRDLLPIDAAVEVMTALQETYVSGVSRGRQFERRAAQGTTWFEMSVSRRLTGEGADARFIMILRNITDRMSAAREIEDLAFYDGLTGLPNRRLLLHRLTQAISENNRRGQHGALLFLDLDHFKTLNDAHGHTMGDALLKQVAIRLLGIMRDGDMVARLGGDEFVVVLDSLGEDLAAATSRTEALGQAILADLQVPFEMASLRYHSSCSIGATLFGGHEQSIEGLLKQADIAMYHAKTAGGKALRFFESAMQTTITARATLQSELHAAIAAREFFLHYQRQVTSEGETVGAEVLIRWKHPHRGTVPPAGFIDLAEETGLIVPIGLWVLEQACIQLERWSHDPKLSHLQLAVNVSARQFRNDDFADQVRDVLIRTAADPSKLKLELTESLLQDKVAETIRKMKSLAAIGIQFSMDDFGTGFSSLSYMTQLPLHQVKIDKFFVNSIGISSKVELIVQTIIGMAHSLDLAVVAEGVETQQQRAFLEKHGCRLYQGYLFGKPMSIEQFEAQVDEGASVLESPSHAV